MISNLKEDIQASIEEFEVISKYLEDNPPIATDKMAKIKLGALHSKRTDCILNAMKLNDFMVKHFNESFSFNENIQGEITQYKGMIQDITVKDGKVHYPKEYLDFITEMENKMNNGNKKD